MVSKRQWSAADEGTSVSLSLNGTSLDHVTDSINHVTAIVSPYHVTTLLTANLNHVTAIYSLMVHVTVIHSKVARH